MLREAVSAAEDCGELPHALIHPDFVPANAIVSTAGETIIVDWTGAGLGPRLWSLAFLLWAAGANDPGRVDSVATGSRRHVHLEAAELDRLAAAIAARPAIFGCWTFSTGREQLADVVARLPTIRARAERIAARAVGTLSAERRDLS